MLESKVPVTVVQQLAGHVNLNTTGRYAKHGLDEKRKAVQVLRVLRVPHPRVSPGTSGADAI